MADLEQILSRTPPLNLIEIKCQTAEPLLTITTDGEVIWGSDPDEAGRIFAESVRSHLLCAKCGGPIRG